jgi:hypothetical protein
MRDVLFLIVLIAFFALAVLFVRACSLVVGQPETSEPERAS